MKTFKNTYLIILLLVSCIFSCTNSTNQNSEKEKSASDVSNLHIDSVKPKTNQLNDSINDYELVVLDQFAKNPFQGEMKYENINKLFGEYEEMRKMPVKNKHDNSVVDTLFEYIYNSKDTVKYYKSIKNIYFYSAEINSPNIHLKHDIQIGINKSLFLKKLQINNQTKKDIVIITDSDGATNYGFIFKKDTLTKISLIADVD